MPELPGTGAEVEALVRGLIKTTSEGIAGVGNVFDEPFFVSGKQDYVSKLGIENVDGNFEVRYLFIDFAGWENTDRGCDQNPIYFLLYTLRVGHEFVEKRSNSSSSSKDFSKLCMSLRDAYLNGRVFGYEKLYNEIPTLSEEVALHDDPHTGIFGHTAEFMLKVEVTPLG